MLRDRKKMAEKIQAMSMEAKASAGIIGSLPPIVMFLVWLTNPITSRCCGPSGSANSCWCAARLDDDGVLVMKKMINFDF